MSAPLRSRHTITSADDLPRSPTSAFVHRLVAGDGRVRLQPFRKEVTTSIATTVHVDADLLGRLTSAGGSVHAALCVLADFALEQWANGAEKPLVTVERKPARVSCDVPAQRLRIYVPTPLHAQLTNYDALPATTLCRAAAWALTWLAVHRRDLESRRRRETREYTQPSGQFALRIAVVDEGDDTYECHRVLGYTASDERDVLFYDPGNGQPKQFTQAYYRLWAEALAMDLMRELPTAPEAQRHRL